jgi:cytochrome c553
MLAERLRDAPLAASKKALRSVHRSMKAALAAALLAAFSAPASPARAEGDPAAGRKLARMCAPCHGRDGAAVRPHTPNIGGLDPDYLAVQLGSFRAAERLHEEMNVVARPLSDAQIADLAAWYAAQPKAN